MSEIEEARKLIGRIHRLEGQVRSLERVLGGDDYEQTIIQFEAVIAASKASFNFYIASLVNDEQISVEKKQQILSRVIKQ